MGKGFLMTDPKYPIFLFDGSDLIIISSHKDLQGDIEPVDVPIFEVFDSDGRRVKLEATRWRTTASIDIDESVPIEEFAGKLRAYLRDADDPAGNNSECDLPCLMEACRKHM
jgi:hypothetical protein